MVESKHWREDPDRYVGHDAQIDEALREAYYRDPFAPYEIVFKDGRRVLIEERMQIAFPPTGPKIGIVLDREDERRLHDLFNGPFIELKQIASVEIIQGSSKNPV
jgi:hypothetical protein